jgi:glyoxylase-like metal-dependent hydrolase (beta-lactamase superfamily II)
LHEWERYSKLPLRRRPHEDVIMQRGEPIDARVPWIRKLAQLGEARAVGTPGPRIEALRGAGRRLGDELRAAPRARGVKTLDMATLPYPTRFAFNGVVPLPWPMITMVHRSLLVSLDTEEGVKHVLFNPTDVEAARATPFFAKLEAKVKKVAPFAEKFLTKRYPTIEEQLAGAGLRPDDIDVIAYDHFHTQDLRRVLGVGNGSAGRFPRALLLAPRREWLDWDGLHPMQRMWFVEDGKRGVPADRVILTDGDLALGESAALLQTPGHTTGNQTLFVHGADGVFGCSENGCSADNWSPLHSTIVGLRRYAESYESEVVLNSNTPELGGEQYTSMVLERSVVDPVPGRPEFAQMFPSSEVIASAMAPGIRPAMIFRHRNSGLFATA